MGTFCLPSGPQQSRWTARSEAAAAAPVGEKHAEAETEDAQDHQPIRRDATPRPASPHLGPNPYQGMPCMTSRVRGRPAAAGGSRADSELAPPRGHHARPAAGAATRGGRGSEVLGRSGGAAL